MTTMLDIPDLREYAQLPSFTAAWAGHKRNKGWPAAGIQIAASKDVALVCTHNGSVEHASFVGFSYARFHYCPQGKWADWVALAHKIIEVDRIVQERRDAAFIVEGPLP